ncbi:MAG TPA: DUF6804 family protein [Terriglobales bacterium]|nr:DUF6804 family protein [Terriglobales bacterium]
MGTLILKYAAIMSLLTTAALKPTLNLQTLLAFIICASGVAVGAQAMRAKKYIWSAVFFTIAVFFNPVFTIQPSGAQYIGVSVACTIAFVLSLFLLRNIPIRTIASITNQNPGSDSL